MENQGNSGHAKFSLQNTSKDYSQDGSYHAEAHEHDYEANATLLSPKSPKSRKHLPAAANNDAGVVFYIMPEWKQTVYMILAVLSVGIIPWFAFWNVRFQLWLRYSECDPSEAQFAGVVTPGIGLQLIEVTHFTHGGGKHYVAVELPNCRMYGVIEKANAYSREFVSLSVVTQLPENFTKDYLSKTDGVCDRDFVRELYGPNTMKVPMKSIPELLAKEIFHPFYMFQYFAVILWSCENYYSYAIVIFLVTAFAIGSTVRQNHMNLTRLRVLASNTQNTVHVLDRATGQWMEVNPSELVPGDTVVVPAGVVPSCDIVLVSGRAVADESMLTGESVPVPKQPFDAAGVAQEFNPTTHTQSVVFAGTRVLMVTGDAHHEGEAAGNAVAVVCRTAFNSAKGQLVAALLYPEQVQLKFFSDAYQLMGFMFVLGIAAYSYSAVWLVHYDATAGDVLIKLLDTITIVVPPALTACLSVATSIAVARLGEKQINVSESSCITWAGLLDVVCFDKTGTLTENGLAWHACVIPTREGMQAIDQLSSLPPHAIEVMATCQSLCFVNDEIVGDPLEHQLLMASGWELLQIGTRMAVRKPNSMEPHKIIRSFDFSPEKLRSAVVVRRPEGNYMLYVKGSPETIAKICKNDSIPPDFLSSLQHFTQQGLRVLGYGYRELTDPENELKAAKQEQLEANLVFGGLILMANELKPDTTETIKALQAGGLDVKMITGDHVQTGIAVSYQCQILAPTDVVMIDTVDDDGEFEYDADLKYMLMDDGTSSRRAQALTSEDALAMIESSKCGVAMTGRALRVYAATYPQQLLPLIDKCRVFARMQPNDKKFVVEVITGKQTLDRPSVISDVQEFTPTDDGEGLLSICTSTPTAVQERRAGFCGDGANDIAALRAATVGVSLCDAQTSVAAPVTSQRQTPAAMVDTIIEGRCSLITALAITEYIVLYAVIQLVGTCATYSFGYTLGDNSFFVQDFFYTTVLGTCLAMTQPYHRLGHLKPPERFFTKRYMLHLFAQSVVFIFFQLFAIGMLVNQSWYEREHIDEDNVLTVSLTDENTVVLAVALAQYMIASVIVSVGPPFRERWHQNKALVICLLWQFGLVLYIIFAPEDPVKKHFFCCTDLGHLGFEIGLVVLIVANAVVSLFIQYAIGHTEKV